MNGWKAGSTASNSSSLRWISGDWNFELVWKPRQTNGEGRREEFVPRTNKHGSNRRPASKPARDDAGSSRLSVHAERQRNEPAGSYGGGEYSWRDDLRRREHSR